MCVCVSTQACVATVSQCVRALSVSKCVCGCAAGETGLADMNRKVMNYLSEPSRRTTPWSPTVCVRVCRGVCWHRMYRQKLGGKVAVEGERKHLRAVALSSCRTAHRPTIKQHCGPGYLLLGRPMCAKLI